MKFEWDGAKSDACLALRGFDFAHASAVFDDPLLLVEADSRLDYGELRFVAFGAIAGRVYAVVFTPRFGKIRIISARKANRREVARYGDRSGQADA
jgi:hypothetical protein